MTQHPELATTSEPGFVEVDGDMRRAMRDQIGIATVLAVSGGRIVATKNGIQLPVSNGFHVDVALNGNDTYVVRRLFVRGGKIFLHGEAREVYCEMLQHAVYFASCFRSYDATEWPSQEV